jgi:hypothetical protein
MLDSAGTAANNPTSVSTIELYRNRRTQVDGRIGSAVLPIMDETSAENNL